VRLNINTKKLENNLKAVQVIEKLTIELPDDPKITIICKHPKQQISEGPRWLHSDVHCNTTDSS
jgi:hypothetical protein